MEIIFISQAVLQILAGFLQTLLTTMESYPVGSMFLFMLLGLLSTLCYVLTRLILAFSKGGKK